MGRWGEVVIGDFIMVSEFQGYAASGFQGFRVGWMMLDAESVSIQKRACST
jgi:hypothetical protein